MRGRSAMLAAVSVLGVVVQAAPAHAAPPAAVETVALSFGVHDPTTPDGAFTRYVVVSWTGEDPSAGGVRVCLTKGVHPSADPDACDLQEDVPAPTSHGSAMPLADSSYAVSVFAYSGDQAHDYSSPHTVVADRTGVKGTSSFKATAGKRVTLTIALSDAYAQSPLPGETVTLIHARHGSSTWHKIASARTRDSGKAATTLRPTERGRYAWIYAGKGGHLAAVHEVSGHVSYGLTMHLTAQQVASGEAFKIYGTVRPSVAGIRVWLFEHVTTPCPSTVLLAKVRAKRQLLPNGRTAFGYVRSLSRAAPGSHEFRTAVVEDDTAYGARTDFQTVTVGSAPTAGARAMPSAPAC